MDDATMAPNEPSRLRPTGPRGGGQQRGESQDLLSKSSFTSTPRGLSSARLLLFSLLFHPLALRFDVAGSQYH